MRALKIDAAAKTITEIDIQEGKLLERAYAEIGCTMIETAWSSEIYPDGTYDTIYVDEEGLFNPIPNWFKVKGVHKPFAGNGVVSGVNSEDGETCAAKISLATLAAMVTFHSMAEIRHELL